MYDEKVKGIHFERDIDDDDTSGRVYTDAVYGVLFDDGFLREDSGGFDGEGSC